MSEPNTLPIGQRLKLTLKRRSGHLGGSPIRKTARAHGESQETGTEIGEILNLVRELSISVEKQAREITEIKRLLSFKETKNTNVQSSNSTPVTSMASWLVASIFNTPISSSPPLIGVEPSNVHAAKSQSPTLSPQMIIDLKACDIKLKGRPFAEIRNHIQSGIKAHNEIKEIVIKKMNKDAKNDHRYFLLLSTLEDKTRLRIYADKWLAILFPNAFLNLLTVHKMKVNNVGANAVINDLINWPTEQAKKTILESTGFTITKIGWLSAPSKKYG